MEHTTPALSQHSDAAPQPPGVMLYHHFYEALKALDAETVGTLIMALMEYTLYGAEPSLDPPLMLAWNFLKSYADADARRYAEKLQRRRAAADRRWERHRQPTPVPPAASAPPCPPPPLPAPAAETVDDEPPASYEWVKEHILSRKNSIFRNDFS